MQTYSNVSHPVNPINTLMKRRKNVFDAQQLAFNAKNALRRHVWNAKQDSFFFPTENAQQRHMTVVNFQILI